ncbi:MAG: esterase [Zoogloeaceae bacterium]|nr:esterase [Zoogloeaceae bacterium]
MLLYLHGFRSAPASHKAQALRARMAALGLEDEFWCPQLPVSGHAAVALAEARIRQCCDRGLSRPTLVGSSLGGYYATWLAERHGLAAILVNPAVLAPLSLETYLGTQTNLYTGESFDFTPAHIAELRALDVPQISQPERYWLMVETGDEILDYRNSVTKYAGARQTVLEGGDHSFTRWTDYLDDILRMANLIS